MQEEESSICVDSLIICCNPNLEVIPSILEPSYVVLSPLNQRFDLALKSPRTAVKKVLWAVVVSIFNSKLFANDSKKISSLSSLTPFQSDKNNLTDEH